MRPFQGNHETRIEEHENDDIRRQIAGRTTGEFLDNGASDRRQDHLNDEDGDVRKPKGLARDPALEIPEKSYPLHGGGGGTLRLAAPGKRGSSSVGTRSPAVNA